MSTNQEATAVLSFLAYEFQHWTRAALNDSFRLVFSKVDAVAVHHLAGVCLRLCVACLGPRFRMLHDRPQQMPYNNVMQRIRNYPVQIGGVCFVPVLYSLFSGWKVCWCGSWRTRVQKSIIIVMIGRLVSYPCPSIFGVWVFVGSLRRGLWLSTPYFVQEYTFCTGYFWENIYT